MKYRKKPIVIEAFQLTKATRESNADWPRWMHDAWQQDRGTPNSLWPTTEDFSLGTLSITTLEGNHRPDDPVVEFNDWIIRGIQGELYPCKPDIFEATYELQE